jgi:hypothetical protein
MVGMSGTGSGRGWQLVGILEFPSPASRWRYTMMNSQVAFPLSDSVSVRPHPALLISVQTSWSCRIQSLHRPACNQLSHYSKPDLSNSHEVRRQTLTYM